MTISEKLLNLIGLPLITNRQFIMLEIESLTDEEFVKLIGTSTALDTHIDQDICRACITANGSCTRTDDGKCSAGFDTVSWLNKPNTENLNIKEILT